MSDEIHLLFIYLKPNNDSETLVKIHLDNKAKIIYLMIVLMHTETMQKGQLYFHRKENGVFCTIFVGNLPFFVKGLFLLIL